MDKLGPWCETRCLGRNENVGLKYRTHCNNLQENMGSKRKSLHVFFTLNAVQMLNVAPQNVICNLTNAEPPKT